MTSRKDVNGQGCAYPGPQDVIALIVLVGFKTRDSGSKIGLNGRFDAFLLQSVFVQNRWICLQFFTEIDRRDQSVVIQGRVV